MAQRKNSVVLSATAIARLQRLVDTGEYSSLDDAASHIIISNLPSSGQYLPASTRKQSKAASKNEVLPSTQEYSAIPAPVNQLGNFLELDLNTL